MNIDYSAKIKEYRERKFLTQKELAAVLDVTYVTVCRWEKGNYKPTMKMKKKLYELFAEAEMKGVVEDAH